MRLFRLIVVFAVILLNCGPIFSQTAPNLENGFKPYGSYDGSHLDTVNLMNGNLMLHAPLIPGAPQRGSLQISNTLYVTSKDWQVSCSSGSSICRWVKGGTGVNVVVSPNLRVHRTVNNDYVYANTVVSDGSAYTITSADESSHSLHGVAGTEDSLGEPTQFDAIDLSGYHLTLSVPDPSHPTVLTHFTVTDREGNKYEGDFPADYATSAGCHYPGSFMASGSGKHPPIVDDSPVGDQYCSQTAYASSVTDRNGNQMALGGGSANASVTADTMGRPSIAWVPNTDFTNCVSPYAVSQAQLYTYSDPNGVTRNIKVCYSEFPIQTAFNVAGVYETATSDSNTTGIHFIAAASVILADGSYWAFNYDNYGEITSIHLPTGGSLSYTWHTIAFPACPGGPRTPLSRIIDTRILDDNQGHSSKWAYNWSAISSTSLVNTVTDPAGNDTTHDFTDLSTQLGAGGSCKFYETSTIYYLGGASGNNRLERTDNSYSVAAIAVDDSTPGIGNIFGTDVVTTVYPSGKVKKVHKDPDTGLGAGLPIFGNVKKELEYDWGAGAPGQLMRETDTTYQWEGNSAYLTAHLLDIPASTIVKDVGGNRVAETDYIYDEPTYLTTPTPAVTTQHVSAPWSVRGNQTTVGHWLNTTSSSISSHTNWYDTGEAYQKIDPLGHTTTFSYDPAYAGGYVTQTCSPTTSGVLHCVSGTYDFSTGMLSNLTNENATGQTSGNTPGDPAHTSNYAYDFMFRLTGAQAPPDSANGGARAQNSFTFSAANVFPLSTQRTKSITTALSDSATSFFDGLGRGYKSQHALPNGTATMDTVFDPAGHIGSVSNPYFTTADLTYGTTTSLYDGLGRATQVTKQDGSISSVNYNVAVASPGDCTDTKDEAGKQRRTCSDALGRLVEVDEPNPGAQSIAAHGALTLAGTLKSQSGVGAINAVAGTGSLTITGFEHSVSTGGDSYCAFWNTDGSCVDWEINPTVTTYDSGTFSLTANGHRTSVNYGSSNTTVNLASAMATAINGDGSAFVYASASNGVLSLTARQTGASTNYSWSITSSSSDPSDFGAAGSFGGSPASGALSGGINGTGGVTVTDYGTVTVTVGGFTASACYGANPAPACNGVNNSTAAQVATALAGTGATGLNRAGSPINAVPAGAAITITYNTAGPAGNGVVATTTSQSTQTQWTFSPASFTAAGVTLANGINAGDLNNSPYVTQYSYDALGNLRTVTQKGSAPTDSTQWRTRTFVYDSLGRLLTANNPESGTISYSYDADGNLLQKTSPAPNQTGSATQTVSYCYDELHRVKAKGYGAQSCPLASPVVSYVYDSGANAKGKLVSLTDQAGTASYTYDILGRLATETRTLTGAGGAAIPKNLSYEYNLDGSLAKLHYPSGAVVTYTPWQNGGAAVSVPASAVDLGNGINYATSATYGADLSLTGFVSGNSGNLCRNHQCLRL